MHCLSFRIVPIDVDKDHLEDLNPILEKDFKKVLFCRAAADGSFSDQFYTAIMDVVTSAGNSVSSDPKIKNSFILKHEFESDKSYCRRVAFGLDPEYSAEIIDKYIGILSRLPKQVTPDNIAFIDNMDGQGCNIDKFANQIFAELFPTGSCTIMVDGQVNGESVIPYCSIIERECVLDWELSDPNNEGAQYKWIKYKRYSYVYEGIKRVKQKQIIVVDPDEYKIYQVKDGTRDKWELVEKIANPLGYVPFFTIHTPEWEPIITNVAKVQFNEMNMKSEVRHSCSIQSTTFLQLPMSVAKQFAQGSANSILAFPDEYQGSDAKFIGPPANTYEPHFRIMSEERSQMKESIWAAQKKTNQAESGESKAFDWLNVEIVLQFASEEISTALAWCLETMTEIDGRKQEIKVSMPIDNAFKRDATKVLDEYLKIKLIGIGQEGDALIRERALEFLNDIPANRKAIILEQIRELGEQDLDLADPFLGENDEDEDLNNE